jgi:thioredoxin reductase (NADPH)
MIYALGAKHRKLNCTIDPEVPIHYCALCDGMLYKDKTVAIIGGGDVAFTQAEYLSKICKIVTIVMCDENITAAPSIVDRVEKTDNIFILKNYPIEGIFKTADERIILQKKSYDRYQLANLQADGIFVAIGMIPNTTPIDIYDVVNKDGYITALDTGISMLNPGFFAAGDCRTKTTRQALTAASDGANAVNSTIIYLRGTNNENNNPMDK